mmetsp:Transcript_7619/g.992  ORF Transcript_7619/g.992 Transcript_7619/m.992 type:complete len:100 (+) Transcript_7619:381-680(+)
MVISPNPSLISETAEYTISYTPVNVHPIGSSIQVTVPSELTLSSPSCSTTVLDPAINCLVAGNVINVTNAFSSALDNTGNVQFKITGIVNPTSTITTSP